MNNGYVEKSMSKRAVLAYENGEKPLSKWTKKAIIEALKEYAWDNDINLDNVDLNKLTLKELQNEFLICSSWHHTGSFYNETDFYSLMNNIDEELTSENIARIINNRKPKKQLTDEEKKKNQEEKQFNEKLTALTDDVYEKLSVIYYSDITKLKSINAVFKRFYDNKMNLEEQFEEAMQAIKTRDILKVKNWEKLGEKHRRNKSVYLYYNDFNEYVKSEYEVTANRRNSNYQVLKAKLSREIS